MGLKESRILKIRLSERYMNLRTNVEATIKNMEEKKNGTEKNQNPRDQDQ